MSTHHVCVFRKVRGSDEYVPINQVFDLKVGERKFIGQFREETVNDGPSGSHKRTICLPVGKPSESTLSQPDIDGLKR